MKDTQETKDVLGVVADLLASYDRARSDDGRVSLAELVGLVTVNITGLITAVRGAGDIPAEAKDYTKEELEGLYEFFLTRMGWEPTDNNRDLAAAYFALIRDTYLNALRILNTHRPPQAEPA